MSTLLILIAAITGNYPDSDRAERYNTQYLFIKLPSGNLSTFGADCTHWHFYNNKRLIKHALLIPSGNSIMHRILVHKCLECYL